MFAHVGSVHVDCEGIKRRDLAMVPGPQGNHITTITLESSKTDILNSYIVACLWVIQYNHYSREDSGTSHAWIILFTTVLSLFSPLVPRISYSQVLL